MGLRTNRHRAPVARRGKESAGIRSERGAVAVEFALLLPVLMIILLGIIEFGMAFSAQITLSNAAREGARTMAIQNSVIATGTAVIAAAPTVAPAIVTSQIVISPVVCAAGQVVTVEIRYPYHFLTSFFGSGYTMTSKAAMRCGG